MEFSVFLKIYVNNRLKCIVNKSKKINLNQNYLSYSSKINLQNNFKMNINPDYLEIEEERNLNNEINRLMNRINSASKLSLDPRSHALLNKIKKCSLFKSGKSR